jgi:soluble cytochrome b562
LSTVFDEQGSSLIQDILNAKNGVSTSPIGGNTTVNTQKQLEPEKNESAEILKDIRDKMDTLINKLEKVEKASNVGTSLGI